MLDVNTGILGIGLHSIEPFIDCILMRSGKSREYEVATIWVTFVNRDLIAVFNGATDFIDI